MGFVVGSWVQIETDQIRAAESGDHRMSGKKTKHPNVFVDLVRPCGRSSYRVAALIPLLGHAGCQLRRYKVPARSMNLLILIDGGVPTIDLPQPRGCRSGHPRAAIRSSSSRVRDRCVFPLPTLELGYTEG